MQSNPDNRPAGGLRLAGVLLAGGMLAEVVATAFHPASEDPNDHPAVFAEYAREDAWIAEHVAQFGAGLLIFAGLVVLLRALRSAHPDGVLPWLAGGTAAAALAAFAALQAVDGVALKHAVDVWAAAPAGERAAAFADAETVRAIEWGANAFFRFLQGAAVALFGLAVARASVAPRWLAAVGVLAGAGYATTGAVVAAEGFSATSVTLSLALDPLFLAFALGLVLSGERPRRRQDVTVRPQIAEPVR